MSSFDVFESLKSPIVSISLTLLLLLYLLNFLYDDIISILALVPVNTLVAHKYIWNIFTSAFYERYFSKLLIDCILLLTTIKNIEIKSNEQFTIYIILSMVISTFGSSALAFIKFFATGIEDTLIQTSYGFLGVYITLLMYLRLYKRNETLFLALPNLTYNNLPIVIISIQSVFLLFGYRVFARDIHFSVISLFYSWIYIRYFYRFNHDGPLGDSSDDYTFVSMFPEALNPVMLPLSLAFYNMGVLCGLLPPIENESLVDKKSQHHLRNYELPMIRNDEIKVSTSNTSLDALQERRKAKAIKLLDAKLAELSREADGWDVKETIDDSDIENE